MNYVLIFLFTPEFEKVLLMKKNKPDFQNGKLNGLGGKIELNETSFDAARRELKEESGIEGIDIQFIISFGNESWNVDMYTGIYDGDISLVKSIESEKIDWYYVNSLPVGVNDMLLRNLKWLIPLCIDSLSSEEIIGGNIIYK